MNSCVDVLNKKEESKGVDVQNEIYSSSYVKKWFARLVVLAALSIVGVLISYFSHFNGEFSKSSADWGTFGDFVGGSLNPLLAFLSFVALLITLVMQSQQLELSRKELSATREELRRAAEAQHESRKVLELQSQTQLMQQFENTFFSLLQQLNKIGDKVNDSKSSKGTLFSKLLLSTCLSHIRHDRSVGDDIDESLSKCRDIILEGKGEANQYFKVLYQVLKFIFESNTDNKDKVYSNVVRSLMPDHLLALLFIHCAVKECHDYYFFRGILEKYAFFEHLNMDLNFYGLSENLKNEMIGKYSPESFGRNVFLEHPDYRGER